MNKTEFIEQHRALGDSFDFNEHLEEVQRVMSESYCCDGAATKLAIAQEECAELIMAISKHRRGYPGTDMDILEELADVTIMMGYVKNILHFTDEDIQKAILVKIRRDKKRLAEMRK